jgi:NTF2 fold immunity protein
VANENEVGPATERLYAFMQAMKKWEVAHHDRYKSGESEVLTAARLPLDSIYQQYLTDRKRTNGRQHPLKQVVSSLGWPPAFDPHQEIVQTSELLTPTKALILTLWTHPTAPKMTEQRKYTLLFKANVWRLDKVEVLRSNGKWQPRAL